MTHLLKIGSVNCRGLQDTAKRREVFNFLRNRKYSLLCLQDTHLTSKDYKIARAQWGADLYLSPGKSNARGVSILSGNSFENKVLDSINDTVGNFLALKFLIENQFTISLINVYGPNSDNPEFVDFIRSTIEKFDSDFVIICGDWNLVQDPDVDYYNYNNLNNPRNRAAVLGLKNDFNLVDPWRICNPSKKSFTWQKKNPVKMARLDFFLISEELLSRIENTSITHGYRTDHSIVELEIKLSNFSRGRGFWKFNVSLLKDREYIKKVKETIRSLKEEYAACENWENFDDMNIQFTIDDNIFFELLLMKIREMTIKFSSIKKKERKSELELLTNQINFVKDIYEESKNSVIYDIMEDLNRDLEKYRAYEMEGLLQRTRAKWIEYGEKPSRYFCSLEKRNYVNKNIVKLTNKKNEVVSNQKEILQEVRNFYKELYSSQDDGLDNVDLSEIVNENTTPKLTDLQKQRLDSPVTHSEILDSLKKQKNDKTPGTSGFQANFYKFFWHDIGSFLVRSILRSICKGELSPSQKLGIISILPKGTKPRELLKNWRPISLLNTSYKIFSGIISSRLKSVLGTIIHENQKGFLSGCFIGENTRLLYDIMYHTEKFNKPGIVLLLDFEKAFDSVSWKYIDKVLKFFNFGDYFIHLVKIILTDIKLCVIQHGFSSDFFNIGRGCRQGDPASPYIFLLCVEILGLMIRGNKDICGIKLLGREYRLLQYADDTTLLLDGSEKSLNSALSLIFQFAKFSGLKPNYDKTSCIKIGSMKNSQLRYRTTYNINWSQESFGYLGITFTLDLKEIIEINYSDKINAIRTLISSWSKRNISTIGRITVVKSLMIPKLNHLFMSLPDPPEKTVKELNTIFFNYIWNSKIDRIARKEIIKDHDQGGLKMIDLNAFIKSLKISWIRRFELCNASWALLLRDFLPHLSKYLHIIGSNFIRKVSNELNPFWTDVFISLLHFRQVVSENILMTSVWHNDDFKLNNKDIFIQSWFDKGLNFVYDFMNDDMSVLSLQSLNEKFNINMPFTIYYNLTLKIKEMIKNKQLKIPHRPIIPRYLSIILSEKKGCRKIYANFISTNSNINKPKHQVKWERVLTLSEDFNWNKHFSIIYKVTKDTKLHWFQFRIFHRILATNSYLYTIHKVNSESCTFCQREKETITHLFWECQHVTIFRNEFLIWLDSRNLHNLRIEPQDLMFGKTEASDAINLTLILFKQFIYKQRQLNKVPNLAGFLSYLKQYQKVEQKIFQYKLQIDKFLTRWGNLNILN